LVAAKLNDLVTGHGQAEGAPGGASGYPFEAWPVVVVTGPLGRVGAISGMAIIETKPGRVKTGEDLHRSGQPDRWHELRAKGPHREAGQEIGLLIRYDAVPCGTGIFRRLMLFGFCSTS
jgi:hypothetical protein